MADEDRFAVRTFWSGRPQTLGEFVDMAKPFIGRIRQFHPIYQHPMMLLSRYRSPRAVELLAEQFSDSLLRTLQRRVSPWRTQLGPSACLEMNGVLVAVVSGKPSRWTGKCCAWWAFSPRSSASSS
jgi:hypothetical protein